MTTELEMSVLALSDMQREAFLDFIGDYPLVIRTVTGFPPDQVCHRAMIIMDMMEQFCVPADLTVIDRAILKASVEQSTWLEPYTGMSEWGAERRPEKIKVLRECAKRLESVGIEIDHMPGGR